MIVGTLNRRFWAFGVWWEAFLSHLPGACSGDGLEEFVVDPELEGLVGDLDVASGAGAVLADADLLPGDADDSVAGDAAADPALTGVRVAARGVRRWVRSPRPGGLGLFGGVVRR